MELNEDLITLDDVMDIYNSVNLIPEPKIPFPQADVFETLLDICEGLYKSKTLNRNQIMEIYDLRPRHYSFYKSAGEYLGLIEKNNNSLILTEKGLNIFSWNDKEKYLEIVKLILQHKPFYDAFSLYLKIDDFPNSNDIFRVLKNNEIYNINSDVTLKRRSSSVKGWIDWIISLISSI